MNEQVLHIVACLAIGYGIGCVSPSYIIGRHRGLDIRKRGSKNAGASNTVIIAGKLAGFAVAILDILKAAAAWWIAAAVFPELNIAGPLAGASCIMGHIFPIALGFRGGKGLACLGGVILAYNPKSFFILLGLALVLAVITNYVCVVTVSMSLVFPAYYYYFTANLLGAIILAVPAIPIFIKHIENFRRMKDGKELRLSFIWNKQGEMLRTGWNDEDI